MSSGPMTIGTSPASTSRMTLPAIADIMPSTAAANQLAPWSTEMAAPEVAKNPIPTASRMTTNWLSLITTFAKLW